MSANTSSLHEAFSKFPKSGPEFYGVFDDFASRDFVAGTGDWVFTAAGSGTCATLDTVAGGAIRISGDGSTDNSGGNLLFNGEFVGIQQYKTIEIMGRFKLSNTDDCDFFFGIFVRDTDLTGGVTDGIYFNLVEADADGKLSAVIERDSSPTTNADTFQMVDATWHLLCIQITQITATKGDIRYFCDGDHVSTHTNVTLPIFSEEPMTFGCEHLSGSTAAETCDIDYMGLRARR